MTFHFPASAIPGATQAIDRLQSTTAAPRYEVFALRESLPHCEIWKVRDRETGDWLALQQLRLEHPAARRELIRQRTAFEVARLVRSDYVVRAVEARWGDSPPVATYEWLDGWTLHQRLAIGHPVSPGRALWLLRQMLLGLSDLWQAGYAHGDLSAEHVFICRNGALRLTHLESAICTTTLPEIPSDEILTSPDQRECAVAESADQFAARTRGRDLHAAGLLYLQLLAGPKFEAACVPLLSVAPREDELEPAFRAVLPAIPRELTALGARVLATAESADRQQAERLANVALRLELQFWQV
jgi:hypothetical protein